MLHLALAIGMFLPGATTCAFAVPVTSLTIPGPIAPPTDEDTTRMLLDEVHRLQTMVDLMGEELARSRIEHAATARELDELRQFIADHHELAQDFESYTAVLAVAEEAARREAGEAARVRRDQQKIDRQERFLEARASRAARQAEEQRLRGYEDRGFLPIGQDVFAGRMAYSYGTNDTTVTTVGWRPRYGRYLRSYPDMEVDFSSMTISGAILNATEEVRNIGVAIAFFDDQGNQVGHSMVQVNNARPDVPYPFTETIKMALNGPFASSTRYVLYADPIE